MPTDKTTDQPTPGEWLRAEHPEAWHPSTEESAPAMDHDNRSPQTTAIMGLPEPLVSVTPSGIFVEWHARGIDVEIRVRETGVWTSVSDRHGRIEHKFGYDSSAVGRALSALCIMESRGE